MKTDDLRADVGSPREIEIQRHSRPVNAVTRRNIKGRPFWSRVGVLASILTERNALNG
jgi:hypothetical protein